VLDNLFGISPIKILLFSEVKISIVAWGSVDPIPSLFVEGIYPKLFEKFKVVLPIPGINVRCCFSVDELSSSTCTAGFPHSAEESNPPDINT